MKVFLLHRIAIIDAKNFEDAKQKAIELIQETDSPGADKLEFIADYKTLDEAKAAVEAIK